MISLAWSVIKKLRSSYNLLTTSYATKIGKGWKEFCKDHQLKESDRVLFEMEYDGDDEDVHVFVNDFMRDFYSSYKSIVINST